MGVGDDLIELDGDHIVDHSVIVAPRGIAVSPQVLQVNLLKRKKLRKKLIQWEGPHIADYAASKLFHHKFLVLKGTVFDIRRWFVWLQLGVLLLVSLATGLYVHFSWKWGGHLQTAATESVNIVIFLLGFYTSAVISRWWDVRIELLAVEDAVMSLSMLASTYVRNSDTQNTKKMLTNYALLVRGLMVKQLAQVGSGGSGSIDCADLMGQEIMAYREWTILQSAHNRIAVVLTWMNKLLVLAVVEQRLVIPEVSLPAMQAALLQIRSLVSLSACGVESQLPFPYVHLITLLVKFALVMQAATLGQQAGELIARGHPVWVAFNIMELVLYSFFFQGLLEIQVILWNPFRQHPAHFPTDLYWRRLKISVATILHEDHEPPFDMTTAHIEGRLGVRL